MCLHFGHGRGLAFFVSSFAFTLVLAWLFVVLIDRRADQVKIAPPRRVEAAAA